MSVTVDKLEQVYEKLLTVVKREVERVHEGDEPLQSADVKALETMDKVLRSALDYYSTKSPSSQFKDVTNADLLKDFE